MLWTSPDDKPLTDWNCSCGFYGEEDERRLSDCAKCGAKGGAIWFVEGTGGYFWCTQCGLR